MVDVNNIVNAVYHQFEEIRKKNVILKFNEWSVLSAILLSTNADDFKNNWKVVSIGTGTRCLNKRELHGYHPQNISSDSNSTSKLDEDANNVSGGYVNESSFYHRLHDSHAEIIARRGFVLFLLDEMKKCVFEDKEKQDESIFTLVESKKDGLLAHHQRLFQLKSNVKFAMYISQSPCGDATLEALLKISASSNFISPKRPSDHSSNAMESLSPKKLKSEEKKENLSQTASSNDEKNITTDLPVDISLKSDAANDDDNETEKRALRGRSYYEKAGFPRTKPGRGDAIDTESMSCSDKIASWTVLGIQGALLSLLIEPIFLDYVIVGHMFDKIALERALVNRIQNFIDMARASKIVQHPLKIFSSSERLSGFYNDYGEADGKKKPSSLSVSWILHRGTSFINNGWRQGVTTATIRKNPLKSCSLLARWAILNEFFSLLENLDDFMPNILVTFLPSLLLEDFFNERGQYITEKRTEIGIENNFKLTNRCTLWKKGATDYQELKEKLIQGPFKGWIVSDPQMKKRREKKKKRKKEKRKF